MNSNRSGGETRRHMTNDDPARIDYHIDPSDPVDAACIAVARDLVEAGWTVDDQEDSVPEHDCPFYRLLRTHFRPLLGIDYRAIRIRALRAELAALEDSK